MPIIKIRFNSGFIISIPCDKAVARNTIDNLKRWDLKGIQGIEEFPIINWRFVECIELINEDKE